MNYQEDNVYSELDGPNETFGSCSSNKEVFDFNSFDTINKKLNAIIVLIVLIMVGMFLSGCLYLRNRK